MSEVQKTLEKWAYKTAVDVKKRLKSGGKQVSGKLINSIGYKIYQSTKLSWFIIKGANYLEYVDKGAQPYSWRGRRWKNGRIYKGPPIPALMTWISMKPTVAGGITRTDARGKATKVKATTGRGRATNNELLTKAIIVGSSIEKKGIKPFPVLYTATAIQDSKEFRTDIAEAAAKDVILAIQKMKLNK